jgi:Cellulase (glycosyl hydrolase family 5)
VGTVVGVFHRVPLALLATAAVVLACAAPARAVETGVVETIGQSKPSARTAARLGAGWVRVWANWRDLQPSRGSFAPAAVARLQGAVAALHARGVKALIVVHQSPAWATGGAGPTVLPANPATYGSFMGGLARRVPADAWEIWNEPDDPGFLAGAPDPARYAALLRAAYPAIKAARPRATVVTGGLVGNDIDFVEGLYAHGARGYFDAVGVHTDTACLTRGPRRYYRDERGRIGRFSFSAYREVHAVMAAHGDGAKQIWMTEIGWNTQSTRPGSCNVGQWAGRKRLGVKPRRQARLLRAAYRCAAADPFIGVVFWFGIQDIAGARFAAGYGLYRRGGHAKPAAHAFKRLRRGVRPRRHRCGGVVDRRAPRLKVLKPAPGHAFRHRLRVRVRASDGKRSAGLRRISLALDGRHVRSWGGRHGSINPWWGSADWSPGAHTLTFEVRDAADNETSVNVTVRKLDRRKSRR